MTTALHLIEMALLYTSGRGLLARVLLSTPASQWAVETAPVPETPPVIPLSLALSHRAQELASCMAKPRGKQNSLELSLGGCAGRWEQQ